MRKLTILAALLLLAPSLSHAKSLEDLLVEKGVITKGEAKDSVGSAPAKVYYNNGTRMDFADAGFSTKINTLIQTRYTNTDADEDLGGTNSSSFDIPHAQLKITGNALHEEFSYGMMVDFVKGTDANDAKSASLRDAWIAWNGCDWFTLKTGQFKTGVSRQFNTGDEATQFADRTITSDYFDLGRQAGATGSSSLLDGALTVTAGIFNGESEGEGLNKSGTDTRHTGILNARYNVMGKQDPFSEADVDWTDNAALNVGAAYAHSTFNPGDGNIVDADTVNVDAIFKYQGWGIAAEYFNKDSRPDTGEDINTQGFYVQAGYFLKPKTLEVAARFGLVDCDDGQSNDSTTGSGYPIVCTGNDTVNQASASINYYWWKHQAKAQIGYDAISTDSHEGNIDGTDNRWIIQLSAFM